jgi:hypothetical protein
MTAVTKTNRVFTGPSVIAGFPPSVLAFAKTLGGAEFGSERFIATIVLRETCNVDLLSLTIDWLASLAEGVDVDPRAKSESVRRHAKVALRDLIVCIKNRTPSVPELRLHRAAQRNLIPAMLLVELGHLDF